MNNQCDRYRPQIAPSLFEDLSQEELRDLNDHLSSCPECREERTRLAQTLGFLKSTEEVEVPKHYFVYDPEEKVSPWSLLPQLSWYWKGALAAGLAAVLLVTGFSATQLQARVHDGSLTLGFGQLPPQAPEMNPGELKAELQQLFNDRLLAAERDWLKKVKSEIEAASMSLSEAQQSSLQAAVGRLEGRFEQRLNDQTVLLTNDFNRASNSIYQTLAHEHQLDFGSLNDRLDLMSVTSQIEGSQRDALVSTLIQFADLRLGDQSQ